MFQVCSLRNCHRPLLKSAAYYSSDNQWAGLGLAVRRYGICRWGDIFCQIGETTVGVTHFAKLGRLPLVAMPLRRHPLLSWGDCRGGDILCQGGETAVEATSFARVGRLPWRRHPLPGWGDCRWGDLLCQIRATTVCGDAFEVTFFAKLGRLPLVAMLLRRPPLLYLGDYRWWRCIWGDLLWDYRWWRCRWGVILCHIWVTAIEETSYMATVVEATSFAELGRLQLRAIPLGRYTFEMTADDTFEMKPVSWRCRLPLIALLLSNAAN